MKKVLASLLCGVLLIGLVGCEKDEKKVTSTGIELGQYKGLTVYESVVETTDEAVQKYIDYILDAMADTKEKTQGVVAKGETITADYVGKVDGKEYTGSSKVAAQLVMTEGTFGVEGFETGLIGKEIGKTITLNLKFADDYADTTLAGKPVVYEVKITNVLEKIKPELTDEFVKENFSYLDVSTVEEFKNSCEKDVRISQVYDAVWQTALENSKVETYDAKELKELKDSYIEYNKSYIESAGYTLDAYFEMVGYTQETFEAEMEEYAKTSLKERLFIKAVAEKEKISVSEEDYLKKILAYAKNAGFDNEAEYLESTGNTKEDYMFSFLAIEVQELICESVVTTPDVEEDTTVAETKADEETEAATKAE